MVKRIHASVTTGTLKMASGQRSLSRGDASTGQLYRNLLCGKQIDARTSAPSSLCLEDEMMGWDAEKGGCERSISRKKKKKEV